MFISSSKAGIQVDLFGDDSALGSSILKQYAPAFIKLEKNFLKQMQKYPEHAPQGVEEALLEARNRLCRQVQQAGHYAYVDYDEVSYFQDNSHYLTIEVIKPEDTHRLRWVSQSELSNIESHVEHDIIQSMQDYEEIGRRLLFSQQLDVNQITCSGYHCLFGFEHPALKPYREIFDQGIRQDKQKILDALNHDASNVRREYAALLVGEFDSAEEIIQTLMPYVNDPNAGVRNAVIRVIASTLQKSKLSHMDVMPFIRLLDSPYDTDRNKAMFALFFAAQDPELRKEIAEQAKPQLLALARLKQPNNRDVAKRLLSLL